MTQYAKGTCEIDGKIYNDGDILPEAVSDVATLEKHSKDEGASSKTVEVAETTETTETKEETTEDTDKGNTAAVVEDDAEKKPVIDNDATDADVVKTHTRRGGRHTEVIKTVETPKGPHAPVNPLVEEDK